MLEKNVLCLPKIYRINYIELWELNRHNDPSLNCVFTALLKYSSVQDWNTQAKRIFSSQ